MAVIRSGLTPDFLADGASDVLDREDKPKLELVSKTVEGDTTPRKVAQVVSDKKEKTVDDVAARARKKAETERQLKELEEQEKKDKAAASKAQYAKVLSQYEPQLNAPPPKFEAPKETFTQLAGLGAMMMMLGAMAGGKTYGSAIGAMNGLAGMFKGYQEGRKEAFDKAKTAFDENLKSWKENKAQVKEALARALKLGSKDLSKATSDVVAELTANGESTVAELVRKRGLPAAAQAFNVASENADQHLDAVQSTIARLSPVASAVGASYAGAISKQDTVEKPKTRAEQIKALKKQIEDYEIEEQVAKAQREEAKEVAYDVIDPDTGRQVKMPRSKYDALYKQGRAPQLVGEAKREKTDAEKRQEAMDEITKGVGARPTLARLLGPEAALATDDKTAKEIVGQLTSIRNTIDLVKQAQNPEIRFGEAARATDKFYSYLRRNFGFLKDEASPEEAVRAIDKAAEEGGLSRNDKNVVFYKEAIFTALELEREARGGSILPVAVMKTLTPLLDPRSQTREQFIDIYTRRANDVARRTGLTPEQIEQGVRGVATVNLSPKMFGAEPAKPSTVSAPTMREFSEKDKAALDWAKANPTNPLAAQIKEKIKKETGVE